MRLANPAGHNTQQRLTSRHVSALTEHVPFVPRRLWLVFHLFQQDMLVDTVSIGHNDVLAFDKAEKSQTTQCCDGQEHADRPSHLASRNDPGIGFTAIDAKSDAAVDAGDPIRQVVAEHDDCLADFEPEERHKEVVATERVVAHCLQDREILRSEDEIVV